MKFSYYAILQYDVDGICISFPDVPSALTCADNKADGIQYATEALELALHGMLVDKVPVPSSANEIVLNPKQELILITVELEANCGKLFSQNVIEVK